MWLWHVHPQSDQLPRISHVTNQILNPCRMCSHLLTIGRSRFLIQPKNREAWQFPHCLHREPGVMEKQAHLVLSLREVGVTCKLLLSLCAFVKTRGVFNYWCFFSLVSCLDYSSYQLSRIQLYILKKWLKTPLITATNNIEGKQWLWMLQESRFWAQIISTWLTEQFTDLWNSVPTSRTKNPWKRRVCQK